MATAAIELSEPVVPVPSEVSSQFYDEAEQHARRETGIAGADKARAERIVVGTGWAAVGVAVAGGWVVSEIWGAVGVLVYVLTAAGPTAIGLLSHSLLKAILLGRFVPNWERYNRLREEYWDERMARYRTAVRATAEYWKGLNGHAFEHELARLLRGHGFGADVTKGSGDGGIDIEARDANGRIAIQCKRYAKPVGPAVIRELYGVVMSGGYSMGILAVTGGVTRGVLEFAEGKPLRVLGLDQLVSLQMELNERPSAIGGGLSRT